MEEPDEQWHQMLWRQRHGRQQKQWRQRQQKPAVRHWDAGERHPTMTIPQVCKTIGVANASSFLATISNLLLAPASTGGPLQQSGAASSSFSEIPLGILGAAAAASSSGQQHRGLLHVSSRCNQRAQGIAHAMCTVKRKNMPQPHGR